MPAQIEYASGFNGLAKKQPEQKPTAQPLLMASRRYHMAIRACKHQARLEGKPLRKNDDGESIGIAGYRVVVLHNGV